MRLRIVHIITCLLPAGSEENTIATCNLQVSRGHDVWLVYGHDVDCRVLATVDARVSRRQEPALRREIAPAHDLRALLRLTSLLRELRPDVVHTHTSKAGFIGRLTARRAGVPVILHGVHILPFLNVGRAQAVAYRALERWAAGFTDAFINVSEGMRRANLAAGLGTARNNHVVYSGMDIERFKAARPRDDRPPGRLIVLVASLEARKRPGEFLGVFARLAQRYEDLRLCVLGEGPLEAALRERIAAPDLAGRVHLAGFQPDVERWIAAAEIGVLPSVREGLPRVVIQYVAVGRPVVVTHVTGIEEIVRDGENGFVVPSGRVADMEAPLERLLSEPDLAARMARAARACDVSRWSNQVMEAEIERIMLDVVARRHPAHLDKDRPVRDQAFMRVERPQPMRGETDT